MVCPKGALPCVFLLVAAAPAFALQNEPLGYDGTNPVIYDNDGTLESGFTDVEVMAVASAGKCALKGILTTCSYGEWDRNYQPSPDAENIRERQEFIEKGRRSGFRNIPNCTAGPSVGLRRPASGRIEDTASLGTPGSWLIVNEARKASAAKPLVIVMGGQSTAVADAWLLDPTIADKVIVAWAAGRKSGSEMISDEYNMWIDPWSAYIVLEKMRVVMFPGGDQAWADTPKSRLGEMPDTEIRTTCSENRWDRGDTYSEPSTDWDAQPLHPLTRTDYVTGTRRLKFSRWNGNLPIYSIDAGGRVLAAWDRSRTVATEEWWARVKDPAAWGPSAGQIAFPGTPWPVPGTIEAERFDHGGTGRAYQDSTNNFGDSSLWNPFRCLDHPDIRASGTASGGYKIGLTAAGEWMEYTVHAAQAGVYDLTVRAASAGAGGKFHVEVDGANATGSVTVPSTGGWDSWTTVSGGPLTLSAGTHVLRLSMESAGATGSIGDFDWLALASSGTPPPPPPPPPPAGLPDVVVTSLAYSNGTFTCTVENRGDAPTPSGVVIGVGYSVDGTYRTWGSVNGPLAAGASTAIGTNGGPYVIPDGTHTIEAFADDVDRFDESDETNNKLSRSIAVGGTPPPPTAQNPYGGSARAIPGAVEAEDFDEGGEGVAFHDATSGNSGGQYRSTDVDLETCADTGGGFNVGWMDAGEWLEYTVDVTQAGSYRIDVRVASEPGGGTFHLEFGGIDKTGVQAVPATGGWQAWTTLSLGPVALDAGTQVMRLVVDASGFNVNSVAFAIELSPPEAGAAPADKDHANGDDWINDSCQASAVPPLSPAGALAALAALALVLPRRRR